MNNIFTVAKKKVSNNLSVDKEIQNELETDKNKIIIPQPPITQQKIQVNLKKPAILPLNLISEEKSSQTRLDIELIKQVNVSRATIKSKIHQCKISDSKNQCDCLNDDYITIDWVKNELLKINGKCSKCHKSMKIRKWDRLGETPIAPLSLMIIRGLWGFPPVILIVGNAKNIHHN